MEEIQAQLRRLLGREEVKRSRFSLDNELLRDPKVLTAVAGLLVLLLIIYLTTSSSKKSTRRGGPANVLLVGPVDAGKTSLFAKIVHNSYPQTHTSIAPSSTTFPLTEPDGESTKQLTLVDLPGHPRLKDEFKKHVKSADGLVFVVDIVGLVRNAGTVAEYGPLPKDLRQHMGGNAELYRQIPPILSALANIASQTGRTPRLLILAHKTDLLIRPSPPAQPSPPDIPAQTRQVAVERLKSILTREMDRLKSARAAGVGGRIEGMSKVTSGSGGWFGKLFSLPSEVEGEVEEDESLVWGGKGAFRWEDVDGVEVDWACSALGMVNIVKEDKAGEQGNGLDEVRNFLWDL